MKKYYIKNNYRNFEGLFNNNQAGFIQSIWDFINGYDVDMEIINETSFLFKKI